MLSSFVTVVSVATTFPFYSGPKKVSPDLFYACEPVPPVGLFPSVRPGDLGDAGEVELGREPAADAVVSPEVALRLKVESKAAVPLWKKEKGSTFSSFSC